MKQIWMTLSLTPLPLCCFPVLLKQRKIGMTFDSEVWCQAGFRGPTQCSDSGPNTGLKIKQHKTPCRATALLTVGTGVPWHVSSRDSVCPLERAGSWGVFVSNVSVHSVQLSAFAHAASADFFLHQTHNTHWVMCGRPIQCFYCALSPKGLVWQSSHVCNPRWAGLPDVAACVFSTQPRACGQQALCCWWFRTSPGTDAEALIIICSPSSHSSHC